MFLLRVSDTITKILMVLAAGWAFVLCFFILADIIFRALNMPLQGTKEIVANSVVMIVFLQVGFAIRSGSMLQGRLPGGHLRPRRAAGHHGRLAAAGRGALPAHDEGRHHARPSGPSTNGEFDGEGALRVPVWPARWMHRLRHGAAPPSTTSSCR